MINVIVPVYNNEETLDAAIQSVVRQSGFQNIRLIISDDASTDQSAGKASKWAGKYSNVELMVNRTNLGVMGNYRKLLDACDGEFIAPLEADDVWISNTRLQLLVEFLSRSDASACFNQFLIREGSHYRSGATHLAEGRYCRLSAFDLIEENSPASFTNCFYRSAVLREVLAETQASFGYDWLVNTIIAARTPGMDVYPGVLSTYHISPRGAWSSLDKRRKLEQSIQTLDAMKLHLPQRYSQNIGRRAERCRKEMR
jgi:glycosyltransferase involved in cell wall biosynthesis